MMKKIFIYLFAATALFAYLLPAQDLDGPLVVMERDYYEQCKTDFFSSCNLLSYQVNNFCDQISSSLVTSSNQVADLIDTLAEQNTTLNYLHGLLTSQSSILYCDYALEQNSAAIANAHIIKDNVNSVLSSVEPTRQEINAQISIASNSFPLIVSSTNLTLVVVVTNTFEMASNELDKAQNVYTNFLNYYRGVQDWMLDQYRATQTNLLNWANFQYWLDYTLWNHPSGVNDSWHNTSYNFSFWAFQPGVTQWQYIFGDGLNKNNARWINLSYTLNANANYVDWLAFNLQGIHDAAQYGTRSLLQVQTMLNFASSNTLMTLGFSNSKTNAMAQFLSAPSTYSAQVAKIATTQNWFQRIEHWLSAIARNTYRDDKTEEGEQADTSSDFNEAFDSVSNQLGITSLRLDTSFQSLGDLTNVTVGVQSLVDSVSTVLDSFKSTSSGNRSGEVAPPNFKLMSTDFIQTTFARANLHTDDSLPDFIGCQSQDTTFGFFREAALWIHHFFGVIWIASALALFVFYLAWLSSWVVTLWYRLLGFVAKLTKFTFGAS